MLCEYQYQHMKVILLNVKTIKNSYYQTNVIIYISEYNASPHLHMYT